MNLLEIDYLKIIENLLTLTGFFTLVWNIIPKSSRLELLRLINIIRDKMKGNETLEKDFKIGDIVLKDFILLDGIDKDYKVLFEYDNQDAVVPQELELIKSKLFDENEKRKALGILPVLSDLHPFAVSKLSFFRKGEDRENNSCIIKVRNSSYFRSLIVTEAMDFVLSDGKTIKEKYYQQIVEYPYEPSPNGYNLVHTFGINILAITTDNKVVICRRNGRNVSSGGGEFTFSVGEHLNKLTVDLNKNKIDIQNIAKRGFREELGIQEEDLNGDIKFHAVCFAPEVCQYGAIGMVHLNLNSREIESRRLTAKDGKFEIMSTVLIDFTATGVRNFLQNEDGKFMQWLLAGLIICLHQDQYSQSHLSKVSDKFKGKFWATEFKNKIGKY